MRLGRALRLFALGAASFAAAMPARAEAPGGKEPTRQSLGVAGAARRSADDEDARRRILFVQQRLDAGTGPANCWWVAWYSAYAGLTVGQAALALGLSDQGLRIDMAVGALTTSLGALTLGAFPLEARFAAARLRALPESTPEQRQRKLGEAEGILRAAAEDEQLGISWVSHVLGNGVALVSGIVLAVAYDRPTSGAINFAAGVLLTEVQILTQPTQAIDDWHQYKRHGPAVTEEPDQGAAHRDRGVRWVIVPQLGGAAIAGSWTAGP